MRPRRRTPPAREGVHQHQTPARFGARVALREAGEEIGPGAIRDSKSAPPPAPSSLTVAPSTWNSFVMFVSGS